MVLAEVVGDVGLDPKIRELAILRDGARPIGERIRAGRIGQVVLPDEGIRRKERFQADDLGVSRRDVEGVDILMLRLTSRCVIQRVRYIEGRSGRLHIEMECAGCVRVSVETIEQRQLVPGVVDGLEFGRVKKAVCARATQRQEVAHRMRPAAHVDINGGRLERSVFERHAAGGLGLVKP